MTTAFAFDLDGTVTTEELLPRIASELDLMHEMSILTELTLSGRIPFEESFRLRCAILRQVPISRVRSIISEVALEPSIERFIKSRPDDCYVVTGNLDVWIQPLVERLGCRAFSSVGTFDGDRLLQVASIMRKNEPVAALKARYDRVVTVGDSVNDIPMFEIADVGVAFGEVHPPVCGLVDVADYVVYRGESLCRLLTTL